MRQPPDGGLGACDADFEFVFSLVILDGLALRGAG